MFEVPDARNTVPPGALTFRGTAALTTTAMDTVTPLASLKMTVPEPAMMPVMVKVVEVEIDDMTPVTTAGLVFTTEYGKDPPNTAKIFAAPDAMANWDGAVVKNCTGAEVTAIVTGVVPTESDTITLAVPPSVSATAPIVSDDPLIDALTSTGLALVATYGATPPEIV